jgi:hypothetical protein
MKPRTKRILKRTLFSILAFFVLLIFATIGLVASVIHEPKSSWEFVKAHGLPADLRVEWRDMKFSAVHPKWSHWDISWTTEDLHVQKGSPKLDAPIDRMGVMLSLQFDSPQIVFHNAYLVAQKTLIFQPIADSSPSPEQNPFEMVNEYVSYLRSANEYSLSEKLHLGIDRLEIHSEKGEPLIISIAVDKDEKSEQIHRLNLSIEQKGAYSAKAAGTLNMFEVESGEAFLITDLSLEAGPTSSKQKLIASYKNKQLIFRVTGNTSIKQEKKKPLLTESNIWLTMDDQHAELDLNGKVTNLPSPIFTLRDMRLKMNIPFEGRVTWSQKPSDYIFTTPLRLFFIDKDMRDAVEKSCSCRLPEEFAMALTGKVWFKTLLKDQRSKLPLFEAHLKTDVIANKLFSLNLAADLKGEKQGKDLFYSPFINSSLVVQSFQGLRQFLDAKHILIPAPFHVLDGPIRLEVDGPAVQSKTGYDIPLALHADLKSTNQILSAESSSTVHLDQKFENIDVAIKLLIHQIQLELPPLDPIRGLPQLTADTRVKQAPPPAPPKKKEISQFKTKITVSVDVDTESDGAIRLLSKLASPNIPITVHAHGANDNTTSGTIKLEPFQIEYLRRKTHVEFFSVDLKPVNPGEYPIKGRLRFDQTEYTIFIDIGGTTKSAQFALSSKPDLDRPDIISVLIFDQTRSQLGESESETAGNVNAAFADQAIGIFGIWLFASTPIRSFNYNTATGVYQATVDLGSGVTAAIGTNWEQSTAVELRRRLSNRWVISASWGTSDTVEDAGKLTLQWEKRF